MMIGALMLPLVNVGITEESTTLSPPDTMHATLGVHHCHVIAAHAASAAGVICGLSRPGHPGIDILISRYARTWSDFVTAVWVKRRLRKDFAGQAYRFAVGLSVGFVAQIVENQFRVGSRVG